MILLSEVLLILIVCVLALLFIFPSSAAADMGAIIPGRNVTVDEPGQKAIIAYNGVEEILILGTDLHASAPTKALRFIPFPSEPQVFLAPNTCFQNLEMLFSKYKMTYLVQLRGGSQREAVEFRFHKRLGAHDVTVVQIQDAHHFTTWVNEFFRQKGLPNRTLSSQETSIITDYVQRGFSFFVFDLVELGQETTSIEPLLYRFPTRSFYYPLKASKLFGKVGTIELFVFGKRREIRQPEDAPDGVRYILRSSSALVTTDDMQRVAPEIAELLGQEALLQAFNYKGVLFTHDVWLPESPVHEYHAYDPLSR
jgi:hypothetical protein